MTKAPFSDPDWLTKGHFSPFFNENHRKFQLKCRKVIEEHVMPHVEDWENKMSVGSGVRQILAREGLLQTVVGLRNVFDFVKNENVAPPPGGFDFFHEMIFVDELCRCGSAGVVWGLMEGLQIGLPAVLKFAKKEIVDEVAADVLMGRKVICLGITEPYAGSDVANLRCTAKKDGDHYVISGQKKWITNGLFSNFITAAVRTGGAGMGGISMILIPTNLAGVKMTQMKCMGVKSSGTTFIELNDVSVHERYLIGKENQGFSVIMHNFNHERWGFAIQATRFSRALLEESFNYAMKRKTFNKRLVDHPVIRDKLGNMSREVEACQSWLNCLTFQIEKMNTKEMNEKLAGPIALLKVQSTRLMELCAKEAIQIFGGNGYTQTGQGSVVERLYRDVKAMAIPGGSEEILLDLGVRQAVKLSYGSKI